jgi:hypothetical protein
MHVSSCHSGPGRVYQLISGSSTLEDRKERQRASWRCYILLLLGHAGGGEWACQGDRWTAYETCKGRNVRVHLLVHTLFDESIQDPIVVSDSDLS